MDYIQIKKLREDLASAEQAYRDAAGGPESVWRPLSEKAKQLRQGFAAALAEGAKPCECGRDPIGMVHQRHGAEIFEVGCLVCVDKAIAGSPDFAVQKWNAGDRIRLPHRNGTA